MTLPNPADFSVNEKPNEYTLHFRVVGEVRVTIHADSPEDAKKQAYEMMEGEDFGRELDDVGDVELDYVRKSPAMYRIIRDGRKMQTSHLEEGDLPRAPDEYGF